MKGYWISTIINRSIYNYTKSIALTHERWHLPKIYIFFHFGKKQIIDKEDYRSHNQNLNEDPKQLKTTTKNDNQTAFKI